MKVKGNHPLAEIIAKSLFGIETAPKEQMQRMINRACKKAVLFHEGALQEVHDYYWEEMAGEDI